jgi:sugar lactone lactonase YvrE
MKPPDEAELAVDARCLLGEGPIWDDRRQLLRWVDITGGRLHRYDPATREHQSFAVGQPVSAMALRSDDGLVLATRDGFALWDEVTSTAELIAPIEVDDRSTRMNDGKCDRLGRFWAGTIAVDFAPRRGSLYSLEPDAERTVRRRLEGLTLSNGLAWSHDDRRMYFIDSATGCVDIFHFDLSDGRLGRRRALVQVPREDGMPDGMTIDREGYLWIAIWGGAQIQRYDPDGTLDRIVTVPADHVTSCTFGGPNLDILYITTAQHDTDTGRPHAGSVFQIAVDVPGAPPVRFSA